MSKFLCKAILFGGFSVRTLAPSPTIDLYVLRNPNVCPLRWLSSRSNEQSFTVSYLINSLGFSPKDALSASKRVNLESPEKPDKVINLFKKYGFTQTQISSLVRKRPGLLLYNSEKTILPKLEFFEAKGISWPTFAQKICALPTILFCSLDKQIIPSYEFFRDFFQSDEKAISAVKRYPDILLSVKNCVVPNMNVLREHGVPDYNIATLIYKMPNVVVVSSDRFREIVQQVEEMGFNASRQMFVYALCAFRSVSKSTWEIKVNAYKKWGLSDEEVLGAFERYPLCMSISEDKIMAGMNFFVNKMGLRPCQIAKRPTLLGLSLDKRLFPRYLVFRALLSKGLVKKEVGLYLLFATSDKKFLKTFVMRYKEEAPDLLKLYKEKLDFSSGSEVDKE